MSYKFWDRPIKNQTNYWYDSIKISNSIDAL